jgi:hypothetical protein
MPGIRDFKSTQSTLVRDRIAFYNVQSVVLFVTILYVVGNGLLADFYFSFHINFKLYGEMKLRYIICYAS